MITNFGNWEMGLAEFKIPINVYLLRNGSVRLWLEAS